VVRLPEFPSDGKAEESMEGIALGLAPDEPVELWLNRLSRSSQRSARCAYKMFEKTMEVAPEELLIEARQTLDVSRITSTLVDFRERCLKIGLKEGTANQYYNTVRVFFKVNGVSVLLNHRTTKRSIQFRLRSLKRCISTYLWKKPMPLDTANKPRNTRNAVVQPT
jgi:hypothetical protein